MDKNTITGLILIAAVLIGFTLFNQPSKEEEAKRKELVRQDSIANAQKPQQETLLLDTLPKKEDNTTEDFFAAKQNDTISAFTDSMKVSDQPEQLVTLENSKLKVTLSSKGGQMIAAELKDYLNYNEKDPLYLFDRDADFSLELKNKSSKALHTKDLTFVPVTSNDKNVVTMRYAYSDTQYIDFIYKLQEEDYMLKFDIQLVGLQPMLNSSSIETFQLNWSQKLRRQEKSIGNEQRYSHIYYKYIGGDVKDMSSDKNDEIEIKEAAKWVAFKNQFFASVIIADEEIETAQLNSKILQTNDSSMYLKTYDATLYIPTKLEMNGNALASGFRYFLGPMSYSLLKDYDKEISDAKGELNLDQLVPLGWALFRWINQWFVIPIFDFLRNTGLSMGIVILLLTLIVKLVISPLTFKSFMSSAKMRVLRPQVEEIAAKYPKKEQAMEKQQATMALYNKAGANPMSGCIPMLLQMPILIALFSFFPNAIELRQQSFLWASDLSTYDAIIEWKEHIPLIGTHLSLFCILMTITNVIYTKFNMEMTNTGQEQMPGMKWMMYLMPIIFLFVLNDYPSGLTYYYFLSLLITILLTLGFRYSVDEDKVLAKLEANKAKPKKKSGFMARLEEAQRAQQQQLKEKNKSNSTKKKR